MEERFKECQFDSRYLIGNNGTVKRVDPVIIKRYKTDILKGLIKDDGYKLYFLAGKWYYSHRLVAIHWIPNPNNYSDVNHRDGVKLNNWWINLEWCTHQYNIQHSYDVLGRTCANGIGHWNYGKTFSNEIKQLMSEAKKGNKHPRFKGYYCYGGVKYGSAIECAASIDFYGRSKRLSSKSVLRYSKAGLYGFLFEPI